MSRRAAFNAFPATCCIVDQLVDEFSESIKSKVTQPFRDALIDAYDRIEELEEEVADKDERINDLEQQVELESNLKEKETAA